MPSGITAEGCLKEMSTPSYKKVVGVVGSHTQFLEYIKGHAILTSPAPKLDRPHAPDVEETFR